jgi:hypothetical protein
VQVRIANDRDYRRPNRFAERNRLYSRGSENRTAINHPLSEKLCQRHLRAFAVISVVFFGFVPY